MMKHQILILAAGKGTRMGYSELPKVLINLKGRPIISYILGQIAKLTGMPEPIIVVGFKHNQVKEVLKNGYTYVFQERQLGTAHAAMVAEKKVQAENVIVLYGDMPFITAHSLQRLMQLHESEKSDISMFTAIVPNFSFPYESLNNFGRIIRDRFNNIVKITEFKDASEAERQIKEVNPGIYMFNSRWLWSNIHKIKNHNAQNEYYLTDIVEVAMQEGEKIHSLNINPNEVLGINTTQQLEEAERLLVI